MAWTRTQQIVVALLPKCSSVLSLFGSTWIIIEVITDNNKKRRKRNHPYHRLLCAMSMYDVLESIWNFASSWPIPQGTEEVVWATGTTATCTAQGFFLTTSVAVPIYNAMLSLYYVLVIVYRFPDDTLRKRIEPSMHIIVFIWSMGTAVWSASTGLINNANMWCWIAPLPSDCLDSWRYGADGNCIRGDNAWIYRFAFYFVPLWFCIFMATVCTSMVYRYVRSSDKSTVKYRNPKRFSYLGAQITPPSGLQLTASSCQKLVAATAKDSTEVAPGEEIIDDLAAIIEEAEAQDAGESGDESPGKNKSGDESDNESGSESRVRKLPTRQCDSDYLRGSKDATEEDIIRLGGVSDASHTRQKSKSSLFTITQDARQGIWALVGSWQESRDQYREEYKRTLEVYHQSLYYLGTFYLTHGFLNYFVYQRPRYIRIRKEYPKSGRIGALYRIVRFSYMPDPEEWVDAEVTRVKSDVPSTAQPTEGGSESATSKATRMTFAGVEPFNSEMASGS